MQFNYYTNTDPIQDIDDSGYIRVSVMASFKTDGRFIPLKAQVEINNERSTFDVIVARTVENRDFITYHCYYMRDNTRCQIDLLYLVKSHIWVTPSPKA